MSNFLCIAFWLFGAGCFAFGFIAPDVNAAVFFGLAGIFCALTSIIVKDTTVEIKN